MKASDVRIVVGNATKAKGSMPNSPVAKTWFGEFTKASLSISIDPCA
jgi:hypothetical protein